MAKNYETYLRDILLRGLEELENNPTAPEVVDIPRSSFKVLIDSFRSGLPSSVSKTLPTYSLSDKKYLQALAEQIKSLLQKPAPEAEKILANMPPIKSLEVAFERAQETQAVVLAQHQNWQETFEQQIKQYNLDLISRLDQQLQKEFPSLADKPIERNIVASDIAKTIQKDFRGIRGDYQTQAQEVIKEITNNAIKIYASEIEELQNKDAEEKINAVSQTIAEKEAEPAFTLRRGQIRAETPPAEDLTYKVSAAVKTSVIANLPPELAQDKELVSAINGEIMSRIQMAGDRSETQYQEYVRQQTRTIITQTRVTDLLEQKGLTPLQIEKMANSFSVPLAEQTTPEIYQIANSPEFGQTPFAGSVAAFAPAGGGTPGGGTPPPGASGLYSTSSIPEGSIEDVFFSSGQPLHLFTAIASPHSAIDLGKWILTAGPIRSGLGFILDSAPGMPKVDYFNVGLGLIFQTQRQLEEKIGTLGDQRELSEAKTRLSFVNEQINALKKIPGFEKFYNFYYGSWGRLLHPLSSLQLWAINKSVLAGLSVSSIVQTLSWTTQYGPAGFAYGVEQLPVQFGMLALKYGFSKTGLYKVVGLPNSRHYVFAPTYELGLRAKHLLYKKVLQPIKHGLGRGLIALGKKLKIPGLVNFGKKIITGAISKFMAALMKFLGFLGLAWGLVKTIWNKIIKPGVLFLFYLIATHGLWAGAGALGGLLLGLPFAIKAFALTFGFFSPFISPFLAWIPATFVGLGVEVLFGIFGAGAGIFLENLWNSFAPGLSSAIGNFSLSSAISGLGLGSYAVPVLTITGTTLTVGYLYTSLVTQGAFFLPQQLPKIQSDRLLVQKTAVFSGKPGEEIKYALTVGAKKEGEKLVHVKISDKTESFCKGAPPSIAERNFTDKIPAEILYTTPWQANYGIPTNNSFNDCLITNTATVTADIENGPAGEQSFYTASVTIGNPPFEYPSGWPLAAGCLTQGPNGSESHSGDQAIDIGAPASGGSLLGADVVATHQGTVSLVFRNHAIYGNYVIVDGSAEKGGFQSLYAHLQTITVARGQKVTHGTKLGTVGSTGKSAGPHLHYEFRGLKMTPDCVPNNPAIKCIPVSIPACVGREVCNICF